MPLVKIENVSKIYGPPKVINSIGKGDSAIEKKIILESVRTQHPDFNPESLTFALENISLNIEKGEFVAIMGPSGSGKSTLMHIIGMLDRPTTGRFTFAGRDVAELSDRELSDLRRNSIGFVFQSFNLLPRLSALVNVALPMSYAGLTPGKRERRAGRILNAVGLGKRLYHRPNQLSGGQKQRVAIGRALANNPTLILADEPTGNLDTATGLAVMELLAKLNAKGKTIVLVTHDEKVAAHAQRIIHIQDGHIPGGGNG